MVTSSLSRRCQTRSWLRQEWARVANQLISSLNWLYDTRPSPSPPLATVIPSNSHHSSSGLASLHTSSYPSLTLEPTTLSLSTSVDSTDNLSDVYSSFSTTDPNSSVCSNGRYGAARSRLRDYILSHSAVFVRRRGSNHMRGDGAAALSSLLKSESDFDLYHSTGRPAATVVPLVAREVSLPAEAPTVDLLEALPPEVAKIYSDIGSLILSSPAPLKGRLKAPRVHGPHSEYVQLVRRLQGLSMVEFTSSPRVVSGVFTVAKSDGASRLIVDARPVNQWFPEAPKVVLPLPSDLTSAWSSQPFYVAGLDIRDFYHRLRLPPDLRPFFALPPVMATEVGLTGGGRVYPCCTTLPMGWSHSVYLAQQVHLHLLRKCGVLGLSSRIGADAGKAMVDMANGAHTVYIDDLGLMGSDKDHLDKVLSLAENMYGGSGLPTKASKTVRPTSRATVLGLEVDGARRTVGVAVDKCNLAIHATRHLLQVGSCSGIILSRLVGHWTWFALIRRPSLSVFNSVYHFITRYGKRVHRLWPSVRKELNVIVGLAPLLFTSLQGDWFDSIVAFDASNKGAGLCAARADPLIMRTEAQLASSRGAAVLLDTVVEAGPDFSCSALIHDPLRRMSSWRTILSHPWSWQQHINLQEIQAALMGIKWILSHPHAIAKRVLLLGDSMVAIGALTKGRSSSFSILRLLRRFAALSLASGLLVTFRYIPTDVNPADGPSRSFK